MHKAIATNETEVLPGLKTGKKKKEISYILVHISEPSIHPPEVCLFSPSCLNKSYRKKAEWDRWNAGSIYSWKAFVGNILQREKKKNLMGDFLDWTMFCFH